MHTEDIANPNIAHKNLFELFSVPDISTERRDAAKEKIKNLGEVYTPVDVVNYILDAIGYTVDNDIENRIVIDPSCGEGIFLIGVVERLIKKFEANGLRLNQPDDAKVALDRISNIVYGVDLSADSCEKTRKKLFVVIKMLYDIVKNINNLLEEFGQIYSFDALQSNELDNMRFDYVIGNPPYIRIQRIKPNTLKETYKRLYKSAIGRFDTSVLFIEKGIKWLKPSGILGFIVSNKFLSSNYGVGIREFILNHSSIKQVINLTDIEPFQVSVLPCIIILKKEKESNGRFSYCLAKKTKYEIETINVKNLFRFLHEHTNNDFTGFLSVRFNGKEERILVQCFDAKTPSSSDIWFFIPEKELEIAEKIEFLKTHTLRELAEKINVGIKTTANLVFSDRMTRDFIDEHDLEEELIHPCLRGVNIKRWKTEWCGGIEKKETYLLYPHKRQKNSLHPVNLDEYPNIKSFLNLHKSELEKRHYLKEAGREWYEIWVPQSPDDFNEKMKIVTCDISTNNRFSLDANRYFCIDSCYYIILKEKSEDSYKFILGLLNSKLFEFYHKRVSSTHIYANKYRYMTSYMKNYPIIYDPMGALGKQIIHFVDTIIKAVNENKSEDIINELENQLNMAVYDLYKLGKKEQNIIETTLKIW